MSSCQVIVHVALAVLCFLMPLNANLRGSATPSISNALTLVWLALLVLATWVYGWRFGGVMLLLSFVYGAVLEGSARRVASRLLYGAPSEDSLE